MSCLYDQTWLQKFQRYIPCFLRLFDGVSGGLHLGKSDMNSFMFAGKSSIINAVCQFGDCGFKALVSPSGGSLEDKSVICSKERK